MTFYVSCWIACESLYRCEHEHATVEAAEDCISVAGGFVRAVDYGTERDLTDAELQTLKEHLRSKYKKA